MGLQSESWYDRVNGDIYRQNNKDLIQTPILKVICGLTSVTSRVVQEQEGSKGFKRKTEVIRDSLIHESPGYVRPFCPNSERKYPRRDNLQRYCDYKD